MTTYVPNAIHQVTPANAAVNVVIHGADQPTYFNAVAARVPHGDPAQMSYIDLAIQETKGCRLNLVACSPTRVDDWLTAIDQADPDALAVHIDRLGQLQVLQHVKQPPPVPIYVVVTADQLRPGRDFNAFINCDMSRYFDVLLYDLVDRPDGDVARATHALQSMDRAIKHVRTLTRAACPPDVGNGIGHPDLL